MTSARLSLLTRVLRDEVSRWARASGGARSAGRHPDDEGGAGGPRRPALPYLERDLEVSADAADAERGGPGCAPDSDWSTSGAAPALTPAVLHAACFPATVEVLAAPQVPASVLGLVITDQSWRLFHPISGSAPDGAAADGPLSAPPGAERSVPLRLRGRVTGWRRSASGTEVWTLLTLSRPGLAAIDGAPDDDPEPTPGNASAGIGEPVYEERTRYLARGATGPDLVVGDVPEAPLAPDLRAERGVTPAGVLDVGPRPVIARRRFTTRDARAWAGRTGDINPIHVSRLMARLFGYRRPILHGAAVDAWAAGALGLDGSQPVSVAAHFRSPVLVPAEVELVDLGRDDLAVLSTRTGHDLVHLHVDRPAADARPVAPAVVLPRDDQGRIRSTPVSQGMAAAALAGVAPDAAAQVRAADPWRQRYRSAFALLSAFDAPQRGSRAAADGLAFLESTVRLSSGAPLGAAALSGPVGPGILIDEGDSGTAAAPRRLEIPLDGRLRSGADLLDALRARAGQGRMRMSAVDAVADLVADPDLLRLDGWTIVCLGAGAELSPAPWLLRGGADAAAVSREGSARTARLVETARRAPGRLWLAPPEAGDVVADPGAVARWIAGLPGRVALVDTLYAPGARFLEAELGADTVERLVCGARGDAALAWYGTPTDVYLLGDEEPAPRDATAVERAWAVAQRVPAARRTMPGGGLADGLVGFQGPNYAAAKRIGRWRATVERDRGRTVSFTVAPMARTRSVLDAAALRRAYAGLPALGVHPEDAETAAALVAALLAWDLAHPEATAGSASFLTDRAVDGGLWASPVQPDGLMPLAVARGVLARGSGGGRSPGASGPGAS